MRDAIRTLFSPLLRPLEKGDGPYNYRKSNRTILLVVGGLFLVLSLASLASGIVSGQLGAMLPFLIFLVVGGACVVVGTVGSDRAVAKIWGNK